MKPASTISFALLLAASTLLLVESASEKIVPEIGVQNATTTTTVAPESTTEPSRLPSPGAGMVNITEVVSAKPERTGRHFGKDHEEDRYRGGYPPMPYPVPYPYPAYPYPPAYPYYG